MTARRLSHYVVDFVDGSHQLHPSTIQMIPLGRLPLVALNLSAAILCAYYGHVAISHYQFYAAHPTLSRKEFAPLKINLEQAGATSAIVEAVVGILCTVPILSLRTTRLLYIGLLDIIFVVPLSITYAQGHYMPRSPDICEDAIKYKYPYSFWAKVANVTVSNTLNNSSSQVAEHTYAALATNVTGARNHTNVNGEPSMTFNNALLATAVCKGYWMEHLLCLTCIVTICAVALLLIGFSVWEWNRERREIRDMSDERFYVPDLDDDWDNEERSRGSFSSRLNTGILALRKHSRGSDKALSPKSRTVEERHLQAIHE